MLVSITMDRGHCRNREEKTALLAGSRQDTAEACRQEPDRPQDNSRTTTTRIIFWVSVSLRTGNVEGLC